MPFHFALSSSIVSATPLMTVPSRPVVPSTLAAHHELLERIRAAVGRVIQGKPEAIELLLLAVLAGGHVLVEDVPGVGKTTLAKAIARVFQVGFSRVQFTPDLLPTDILGSLVLDPREGSFPFHRGPIFTNVLLADEINRASPRTQSALLEAMSEAQVTVDGTTYPLSPPFFVFATQNPHEFSGTYPLPEAQLDRFLLRVGIGYPAADAELSMLYARQHEEPLDALAPLATGEDLAAIQAAVRNVEVETGCGPLSARRGGGDARAQGRGPRGQPSGALSLFPRRTSAPYASGRAYVSPDDVWFAGARPRAPHCAHPEARYGGRGAAGVLDDVVRTLACPVTVDLAQLNHVLIPGSKSARDRYRNLWPARRLRFGARLSAGCRARADLFW
jgi:MoxR-like ATPase